MTNSDPSGNDTMGELALSFDMDSELLNAEFPAVAINYYRQWDPTFGQVQATVTQSDGTDQISLLPGWRRQPQQRRGQPDSEL